ncbi:PBSX family phage terminase large subunit [Mucilaginibacter endophyticus]|uniref:PBSX family phage terminase large subunit n=1 Tax=Mucilaginibacter endophyticus TaxID=2675003 RepID=UPI000E0D5608|nr:PBSX family phage terminase large subunit [Mucilaginibacter endophyticus]
MAKTMRELKFDFNPDIFNNIFWHLKAAFLNVAIRFIWVYGGSSASKTYSVVQLIIIRMLEAKDENTMVLRKYAVDIKDSIYSDFTGIIKSWGLEDYFLCQQNYIVCKITGSYVRFRGLDDSEKIKGLANFKRVVLEEISQFDETDLKQIRKRLRGRIGQQIIGIFNPVSEEHWIKTKIFDLEILTEQQSDIAGMWVNEKGNLVIMKTNYLDNKYIVGPNFVDQHTIDDFEKDKINDYEYYRIYGLGDWGKLRTGGEFWKQFKPALHVNKIAWDKSLPIWLSCDENVNPYIPWTVWQLKDKHAQQIDEIFLEDPRNRVVHAAAEFKKRYPAGEVSGLFVGGDRTSIKEDTKKEKGENYFTDIMTALKEYRPVLKIQAVNPSVVQSGNFINEIYGGTSASGITIGISDVCKKSIYDYQYTQEASDGTVFKKMVKHPVTKVPYQEFGHATDCKRYLITHNFAAEYLAFINKKKSLGVRALSGV